MEKVVIYLSTDSLSSCCQLQSDQSHIRFFLVKKCPPTFQRNRFIEKKKRFDFKMDVKNDGNVSP